MSQFIYIESSIFTISWLDLSLKLNYKSLHLQKQNTASLDAMHQSGKKQSLPFKSPSAKSKQYNKSITKSHHSIISNSSSVSNESKRRKIRDLMTSDPYNRVFNKLINIGSLGEFVRQSSQYVDFQQQDARKYVPLIIGQKPRFSFSLKSPNLVSSYLVKDYRFLRHYYSLLVKQYPQKKDQYREEIYQLYKDSVVNKNKFDYYFLSHQINLRSRKSMTKSAHKIKSTQKSHKTLTKPLKKPYKHQNQQEEMKNQSLQIEKIQTKNVSKPKTQTKNNENSHIQLNMKVSQSLKASKHIKSTQQNIKIIEDTLNEIQQLIQQSPSLKNRIKQSRQNVYNNTFGSKEKEGRYRETNKGKIQGTTMCFKSKNNKKEDRSFKKNTKKRLQQADSNNNRALLNYEQQMPDKNTQFSQNTPTEEQIYEQMLLNRSRNKPKRQKQQTEEERQQRLRGFYTPKSKLKQTTQSQRKSVKFCDIYDINDPKHRQMLDMLNNIDEDKSIQALKKKQQEQDQNEIVKRIHMRTSQCIKQIKRPFGESEKVALTKQLSQIVELFPQIDQIGDGKYFTIDREPSLIISFGQCYSYAVELALCWPTDNPNDDIYKCLYLKKIDSQNEKRSSKGKNNSIEQFKQKIAGHFTGEIELLIIEK